MLINLCILLLVVKKELDDQPFKFCEYLLSPIAQNYSNIVTSELGKTLREDISLLVNHDTSSIFRYQKLNPGLNFINSGRRNLQFKSEVDKKLLLFFIDKESLLYYPEYKKEGLEVIKYEGGLITDKHNFILLEAYKAVREIDTNFNIKYYEFDIKKSKTEFRVEHSDIGVIHNTLNKDEDLETHFKSFYSDLKLVDKPMYEVSELYIKSLNDFLYKKEIIKKEIDIKTQNLFPFKFTRDLTKLYSGEIFVTGGICFDKLNSEQKKLFDLKKLKKYGERFIFTYHCKVRKDKILLDPVY